MGCDIHMRMEIKCNHITGFYWKQVGAIFQNPYYDPTKIPDTWNQPLKEEPFNERDYDLFGILAGVRNEDIERIADPKGVPSDASDEVKEWANNADAHSHSWLTLQELRDYKINERKVEPWTFKNFQDIAERMRRLANPWKIDPSDIRIVFWFDN